MTATLALPLLLGGCSSWFFGDDQLEPQRIAVTEKRAPDPSFPNLASVPEQAPLPSPSARRADLMSELSADRQNARYSTDPLAPSNPAYPPPPAAAPAADAATSLSQEAQLFGQSGLAYQSSPGLLQYQAFQQQALAQQRMQQMELERRAFEQQARQHALQQQREREQVIQQQAAQWRYSALQQQPYQQPAYQRQPYQPPSHQQEEIFTGQPVPIPSIAPAAGPFGAPLGDAAAHAPPPVLGADQLIGLIYFGHGSAQLDQRDLEVLREVAALQRQQAGSLRVVGHASSRTGGLDAADHELVNMNMSVQRANSVAAALAQFGVEDSRLYVEGYGDTQPVYHEFMATGEAGNRRVEIFLE